MNLDALAIALRPRPMLEAADLGVRLTQQSARSVWHCWLSVALPVFIVAFAFGTVAAWGPTLLIFLAKPWLDRTILIVLSRAAFAQPTRFVDVLEQWRAVWAREFWRALTVDRFTFWRAYTLPVTVLEGATGAVRKHRIRQLARGKRGVASLVFFGFYHVEFVFALATLSLLFWFAPEPVGMSMWQRLSADEGLAPWMWAGAYALAVLVVEPFYVASGFTMYLNRRVELEAWDIEQEFRRAFVPPRGSLETKRGI